MESNKKTQNVLVRIEETVRWLETLCKNWEFFGVEMVSRTITPITNQGKNPSEELAKLGKTLEGCTRCRLSEGRTHIVFGDGNPDAQLVFVGEGPGHEEDIQGLPFVGQAGRLLTKMIHSIGLSRKEVYICNVVKCRPPQNRTPLTDEIATCSPFLLRQLEIIQPKVICALGACAVETLLKTRQPINRIRRKLFKWQNIFVVATFHPAYLLRNPIEKRKAWEDLLIIKKLLMEGT
ncbi:MAG: uracil-DNA glycosylase [Syntrophobacterales bacterium]|nr:uracil-DNA glycosylase [Syntrophobacterales bacterium]